MMSMALTTTQTFFGSTRGSQKPSAVRYFINLVDGVYYQHNFFRCLLKEFVQAFSKLDRFTGNFIIKTEYAFQIAAEPNENISRVGRTLSGPYKVDQRKNVGLWLLLKFLVKLGADRRFASARIAHQQDKG